MTITAKIIQHVSMLPEAAQSEVLDFVEYLELKSDRKNWSDLLISQAMRGMESEEPLYFSSDIKG